MKRFIVAIVDGNKFSNRSKYDNPNKFVSMFNH